MRLTCPNCGAQYVVDDRAIPEAGRDVQCSNCGNTWFQTPPLPEPAMVLGEEVVVPPSEESEAPTPQTGDDPADMHPEEIPEQAPAPQRRPVSEDVLAVLREEAALEQAARRAEAGLLETQGELDVPPAPRRREPAPIAPEVAPEPIPEPRQATGRAVLPDVEEIHSALDTGQPPESTVSDDPAQQGRGRRLGMALAFLGFGIAAALYLQASRVAEILPATAEALDGYVETVDAGRAWLDRTVRGTEADITEPTATE